VHFLWLSPRTVLLGDFESFGIVIKRVSACSQLRHGQRKGKKTCSQWERVQPCATESRAKLGKKME